jgi:hypothetical protein
MGEDFPDRIDHWVSFHGGDLFTKWAAARAANGHPPAACYWGAEHKGRRMGRAPVPSPMRYAQNMGGSSGYLAARGVAIDALGVDRVVLAGVPMEAAAAHYAAEGATAKDRGPWLEAGAYWRAWEADMDLLRRYVRSMSGRTRAALGYPTREWLGS